MLCELVANTRAHVPGDPLVAVELVTASDPPAAVLRYGDSGPGLPADEAVAFNAGRTTARGRRGLSWVRRVVEEHLGTVCYRPAGPTGWCFEFRLPLAAAV